MHAKKLVIKLRYITWVTSKIITNVASERGKVHYVSSRASHVSTPNFAHRPKVKYYGTANTAKEKG